MSFLWIWHLSLISADSKTARRRKCRTYSIAGWRIIPFYVSIFGFIPLYSWWISHWYVIFKVMLQLFRSIPEFKTKQNGWQPSIGLNSTFQWNEEQKIVLQWSWRSSSSCFISCFPHPSHPHGPPYPHVQLSLASSSMSSYNWSGIAESGHMKVNWYWPQRGNVYRPNDTPACVIQIDFFGTDKQ